MSELDKITTQINSSITDIKQEAPVVQLNELIKSISTCLNLSMEESFKLKEGLATEKNKNNQALKIFLEVLIHALDKNTIDTSDKEQEALFIQNKKIIKDLTFNLLQLYKNYSIDDKEMKITLLGKLIQSLYDGKR